MTFTSIKSFSEIAEKYDGFILDQYGVMHNGSESLPGSVECIQQLASMGKKLIILSNTSSPSSTALDKLPKLGFDPDNFVGAVTSGEEAARYIKETYGGGKDVKKAIWFTWDKPAIPLAFLSKCGNVEGTTNVEEADFVITHGSEVLRDEDSSENVPLGAFMDDGDFSVIDPVLELCLARKLPMVCANPDLIVKLPGDVTASMPGENLYTYCIPT
jgi:ribonucleotide monophosphatase NagD (HAD superfamily)